MQREHCPMWPVGRRHLLTGRVDRWLQNLPEAPEAVLPFPTAIDSHRFCTPFYITIMISHLHKWHYYSSFPHSAIKPQQPGTLACSNSEFQFPGLAGHTAEKQKVHTLKAVGLYTPNVPLSSDFLNLGFYTFGFQEEREWLGCYRWGQFLRQPEELRPSDNTSQSICKSTASKDS